MKQLFRTKQFKKSYKKRIPPNSQLDKQLEVRLTLFMQGERGYPLNVRVIYEETDEAYVFLDIGSHNQVYS